MTVPSATSSVSYDGNGSTQIFSVPFYFLDDTHLVVQTVTAGVATTKVLNADYTVSGAGNESGGEVTMLSAPAVGTKVYIFRQVPLTQLKAYVENTPFPAATQEQALDQLTMAAQQLYLAIQGALRLSAVATINGVSGVLPEPAANQALGWNATANGLQNIQLPDAGTGTYVPGFTGAVASRLIADKLRESVSVLDFGADKTGVADSTAAFNSAMAAADNVYVPPGTYLISDAVTITSGKRLFGAGRRKTILHMPSTFNAAALGCLVFSGGEPGPVVEGICVIQDQPDSLTPTVYPPCIYARTAARFSVRHVRMPCVYAGIDMQGNTGGAVMDDVEMSALSVGINIDGSQDTVRISKFHSWPFGGSGSGTLTANQQTAFGGAYGIKSARCDGLSIEGALFYLQPKGLYLYSSANGSTFGQLANCGFDGDGGLTMSAGTLNVVGGYFSNSSGAGNWVNQTGGDLVISGARFVANAIFTGSGGLVTTGSLTELSGCYFKSGALDTAHLYASGTVSMNVVGCTFSRMGSGAYAKATIEYAGASAAGTVVGCFAPKLTSGTGTFVKVDVDVGVAVTGNAALGWAVTTPAASALASTKVGGNLGANKDTFSGYFSSDATTTVRLPAGWTVSRLGAGNYQLVHNLSLSAATDIAVTANTDNTAPGSIAVYSLGESLTSTVRLRTYVGTTSTDAGVFFSIKRVRA